jgi:hypothetical protein
MKDCIYRHSPTDFDCGCTSDKLIHGGRVTLSTCGICPYRVQPSTDFFRATAQLYQQPGKHIQRPTSKPCGGCDKKVKVAGLLPPLAASSERWTVAVTTAPRTDCTLVESINSIRSAGWEPIVFAEPNSTETDCQTIQNDKRHGVWFNWLKSARWCVNNTDAELIMTVQDDAIFHPDSLEFTESILWPHENCGFVSLYTPKHYTITRENRKRPVGVNRIPTQSLWGACALVWDRRVLKAVVNHPIAKSWLGVPPSNRKTRKSVMAKRKANPWMVANSDTAIGKILNALKRPMFFVDPSPVSHVAIHSTIGHGDNKGRRNCIRCADHSVPLADQVPLPPFVIQLAEKKVPVRS